MLQVFGTLLPMIILILLTQSPAERHADWVIDKEHAFYLSVIEVSYPVEDGKTALRLKVFSDDLQNAVSEFHHTDQLINFDALCTGSLDLVIQYLTPHIQVHIDDAPAILQMRDCEVEGDSHWLTFEISASQWKEITLTADFFMELFPTQTHIVSVISGEHKRFARLTKDRHRCAFNLQ